MCLHRDAVANELSSTQLQSAKLSGALELPQLQGGLLAPALTLNHTHTHTHKDIKWHSMRATWQTVMEKLKLRSIQCMKLKTQLVTFPLVCLIVSSSVFSIHISRNISNITLSFVGHFKHTGAFSSSSFSSCEKRSRHSLSDTLSPPL